MYDFNRFVKYINIAKIKSWGPRSMRFETKLAVSRVTNVKEGRRCVYPNRKILWNQKSSSLFVGILIVFVPPPITTCSSSIQWERPLRCCVYQLQKAHTKRTWLFRCVSHDKKDFRSRITFCWNSLDDVWVQNIFQFKLRQKRLYSAQSISKV